MTGEASNQPTIIKANGEREPFKPEKLEHSLKNAGASEEMITKIIDAIEDELEDGMTTKRIYDRAFDLLSKERSNVASRYSLRNAVMQLGPTGFPLEQFVARIFREKGYKTEVGVEADGACGHHEIDVVAYTESELNMVEVKFHNERGITSDMQTALYTRARFDDLSGKTFSDFPDTDLDNAWLVTNTKFTSSAISYGECAGLMMVGWDHPDEGNLHDLIESTKLQPVTCLTSLSESAKQKLLEDDLVLCQAVSQNEDKLREHGLTDSEIAAVRDEANQICAGDT